MTNQQLAIIGAVLSFLGTFAVNRGWISKDTFDWLISPSTLSDIGIILGGAISLYGLYASRKHGLIKSTANLPQVDAVVVAPKTATEIPTDNVVATAEAAEPFVKARRRRASHGAPPAATGV